MFFMCYNTWKMSKEENIKNKYEQLAPHLNEKTKRLWCALEALELKKFGITIVSNATKVSRPTIYSGIKEIKNGQKLSEKRIRKKGGGAKKLTEKQPTLIEDLEALVEPTAKGDPENPLRWTCKGTEKIAKELKKKNYKISPNSVRTLLKKRNYSLQLNQKARDGKSVPDRDKQFKYINKKTKEFQKKNCPVISVDAKKKELIGNFKNNGREYCKSKNPIKVNTHDFPDKEKGKVAPYGVYDIGKNKGWVSVGITKDTAEFAVNTVRSWWFQMGKKDYEKAKKILITADCGGSNGYRTKLWKWELQKLANELNKEIHISHFPPGTSKWNKIEHRMFSYISQNWRGRPLITREVVIQLIGNTKTKTGLKIQAQIDLRKYKTGIEITKEQMQTLNIKNFKFRGEWNYKIIPQKRLM
jgi:hypothetical protein